MLSKNATHLQQVLAYLKQGHPVVPAQPMQVPTPTFPTMPSHAPSPSLQR